MNIPQQGRCKAAPRRRHFASTIATATSLALLAGLSSPSQAAGYRFGTQSAAGEGTANANGIEGIDASTIFANPAALMRLGGTQFSGVLDYVRPDVRFTDAGSTISLPGSGLTPRVISTAGESQSPAKPAWVPHLYASYRYSDELAFGVGMFVPFGAKLDYLPTWGGRYNLNRVDLKSLAFNPNVAWKVSSQLSLAAGLTAEYMAGDLRRTIPYGSVLAGGLLAAAQQAAAGGAPGLATELQQQAAQAFGNSALDGDVHMKGKDWGLGSNLALMWELDSKTRVGMAWRSTISHKLKGDVDWTQPASLPASVLPAVTGAPADGHSKLDHNDGGAHLNVKTPDSLSFQAFHQLSERFAIMADATWYRYSRLEQLRIEFDRTTAPSVTAEHWNDAWRVSLGGNWRVNADWLLRAGVSYDKSPLDTKFRSPALPDSDRTWLALGANVKLSPQADIDLSFGYIKLKDAPMQATDDGEGLSPCSCAYSTVRGNYQSSAKTLGLQFNYKY